MRYRNLYSPLLSIVLLASCDDVFQTHPYDVHIKGEHNLNTKNMARIEEAFTDNDTLRIAFISDTHLWHSDARDEVADVNHMNVDFVVHCGDLTDTGTTKEFEWSRDILNGLRMPYVALIGNHDFLGTGDQTYSVMYGKMDFSFIAARVKFVCLNTNATEYDYMAAVPNFDFMEEETTRDSARFDRTVIVMHAPPYSDQFNNNVCKAFRRYLDFFPGLMCCVYGHCHGDDVGSLYDDDLRQSVRTVVFWGIDCAEHRNYRIMTITPDGYEMEQIRY
ncbi:3',5'-cyclic AMP phosphodiesterase CpdA [Prevotella sp. ne3005]|uniref:metallophosphoesterase family protein n=1 Tax=Prevotella sp. ne3005 TaxID=1761887 RepID=UPI0008BA389C|nr:metallophosphoesterase [Prevotella sp. ne3005]MBP3219083.1 metallophosphoesterase [Prevotella sp.]SEM73601.1 3',5'-cyclic AMP phosphodiesterase CpdA [Prevotella sp. ne3005]